MTNEAIIRRFAEKEDMARMEGIRSIIMDFRQLLHQLKACSIPNSTFDSTTFIYKYSPLYKHRKKKV
jgi:hypothetical protein